MLTTDNILQGRYRIVCQLGHGGMGAVYEAQDKKRFNAPVALKEILIDLAHITDAKQHELLRHAFEREAKILAEVQHEVFPHVIEYFCENDRQFLVMELVQGADLAELLAQRKTPFPLKEIVPWTEQLLDALDYLHSKEPPIFHRDLKPQNLKLTARGRIKLLDFGIAKSAEAHLTTTITNQTFIAATLNYSPFEQILRVLDPILREVITQRYEDKIKPILEQNADARSDLYSLGATLYHLSTGYVPTDALKRTLEIWSDHPDPLRLPHELNPKIPEPLSRLILKAMEIEREDRFASATEMQQALTQALADIKNQEDEALKKREEAQRAIWLAEQKKIENERLENERQRLEAERKRLENERLENERLMREAEERRLLAEKERQRIEAERERLEKEMQLAEQEHILIETNLDKLHRNQAETFRQITPEQVSPTVTQLLPETDQAAAADPAATNLEIGDGLTRQSYLAGILPDDPVEQTDSARVLPPAEKSHGSSNVSMLETKDLPFMASLPSLKASRVLPIAVLLIFILGGAVFGIWLLQSAGTPETPASNTVNTDALVREATPEPTVEKSIESDIVPSSSLAPVADTAPASRPAGETRSDASRPPVKPASPAASPRPPANRTAKPTPEPNINLDDIIKPRKNP